MTNHPHLHRFCWGGPEWLTRHGGEKKPPPEPHDYCRCGLTANQLSRQALEKQVAAIVTSLATHQTPRWQP
jgi:hypothetical protein